MNKVQVIGRLTKDPEVTNFQDERKVCRFSVAVNRNYKNENGNFDADFIDCVAWNGKATLFEKHFSKGDLVGIVGRLRTNRYETKDGAIRHSTDIEVEEVTFITPKKNTDDVVEEIDDDDLPI